jgi:hypothetical protein
MPRLMYRCGFLALCAVSALLPLTETSIAITKKTLPAWPATWEGAPLRQIPLTEREMIFNRNFPGQVAKFTDGRRELILRWVTKGTRQLHSSSDCFRGTGYSVTARPAMLDAHGARWSCFAAEHGRYRLLVRERITDERGREWTDVSAWFWSVLLKQTEGPWLAVTVVESE